MCECLTWRGCKGGLGLLFQTSERLIKGNGFTLCESRGRAVPRLLESSFQTIGWLAWEVAIMYVAVFRWRLGNERALLEEGEGVK